MKKAVLVIFSVFSLMCIFMFHANIDGILSVNKIMSPIKDNKKSENVIPIAMATDNNYAYPTIVAMTSILKNRNNKTHINFYIMLSGDFDQSLKDKIESLKNKYKKCSVSFIDMEDKLKDLYTSGYIKTASYYRLLLPNLLPDLDKILYMDVDTITQGDLSNLFDTDIEDYYLAGVSDKDSYGGCGPLNDKKFKDMFIKQFGNEGTLEDTYVNGGVLLFNLKKMRKYELVEKLIECASSTNFNRHDQDVVNYICHDKIKNLGNSFNCAPHLINNIRHQVIIHYMCSKPWNDQNVKYSNIWWRYAKKTGFINEIQDKFLDESAKKEMRFGALKNIVRMIKKKVA